MSTNNLSEFAGPELDELQLTAVSGGGFDVKGAARKVKKAAKSIGVELNLDLDIDRLNVDVDIVHVHGDHNTVTYSNAP